MNILKTRRRKVVASAITGAMLAGVAGIAYFAASDSSSGSATGGTINLTVEGPTFTGDLYPVADTGDTGFTAEDFVGADEAAAKGSLTLSTTSTVELLTALSGVRLDGETDSNGASYEGEQYKDLYLGLCEGATFSTDCYFASVDTLVNDFGNAPGWSDTVIASQDVTRNGFLFLADNGTAQDQGVTTSLIFEFDARTTGDFGQAAPTTPPPATFGQTSGANPDADGATGFFQTNGTEHGEDNSTIVNVPGDDFSGRMFFVDGERVWTAWANHEIRVDIFDPYDQGRLSNEGGHYTLGHRYTTTDSQGRFSVDLDDFTMVEDLPTDRDLAILVTLGDASSAVDGGFTYFNIVKESLFANQGVNSTTLDLADAIDFEQSFSPVTIKN